MTDEPLLRTVTDLSEEELHNLMSVSKDWQYLVYRGGGVARKSDLEDWLTEHYQIDRYTGHIIGNHLTETFNPAATWSEGRPAPKLSDYPDLWEKYHSVIGALEILEQGDVA